MRSRSKYIAEIVTVLNEQGVKPLTEKETKIFGVTQPDEYLIKRLEDVRYDKLSSILENVTKTIYKGKSASQILKSWSDAELLVIAPEIREIDGVPLVFIFNNTYLQFKEDKFIILVKGAKMTTKEVYLIEELDSDDDVLSKIKTVEALLSILDKVKNDISLEAKPYRELLYKFLLLTAYKGNDRLKVSYKVFDALVEAFI